MPPPPEGELFQVVINKIENSNKVLPVNIEMQQILNSYGETSVAMIAIMRPL